jgi:hypothetical protein
VCPFPVNNFWTAALVDVVLPVLASSPPSAMTSSTRPYVPAPRMGLELLLVGLVELEADIAAIVIVVVVV